jgi:hypothetical protein
METAYTNAAERHRRRTLPVRWRLDLVVRCSTLILRCCDPSRHRSLLLALRRRRLHHSDDEERRPRPRWTLKGGKGRKHFFGRSLVRSLLVQVLHRRASSLGQDVTFITGSTLVGRIWQRQRDTEATIGAKPLRMRLQRKPDNLISQEHSLFYCYCLGFVSTLLYNYSTWPNRLLVQVDLYF